MKFKLFAVIVTVSVATSLASAQHHKAKPNAQPATVGLVAVYGAFKRMVHMRDFEPKVRLNSVMHAGATEAVGAVAGLRGEITAIDGKLLVTYGNPCPNCVPTDDHATLLASARVTAWHPQVTLPSDLAGQSLDAWIVEQAKAAGLDVTKPFALRLRGTLTGVAMHVIKGSNPSFKGHGSGHVMADQENVTAERIEGEVVGFYAPPDFQGVITHPGEPFHFHWVDLDRTRTAHLDAFGMAQGAHLLLPRH